MPSATPPEKPKRLSVSRSYSATVHSEDGKPALELTATTKDGLVELKKRPQTGATRPIMLVDLKEAIEWLWDQSR